MTGRERRADHVVFRIVEAGVVEAHRAREQTEDIDVRFHFARPRQSGPGELHIIVAVSEVQVGMFEECSDGQNDVRVVGRVGLELLEYDRKEILARHALQHQILLRRDRRRVRIVDDHRLHRRIVDLSQRLAEFGHIEDPARASRFNGERSVCSSGISSAARLNGYPPEVDNCAPPPTSFHDPVSAGRARMPRTAAPPRSLRWTP